MNNTATKSKKDVKLAVMLTDREAWDLAQFLKRVGFSEFKGNAENEDEAYRMRDAAAKVAKALAEEGYAPR